MTTVQRRDAGKAKRFEHLDKLALVKAILEKAEHYAWTLQGFGMLRTYLSPDLRLHVWDSRYQVPDVSQMHTHPWHFHSFVIAGVVRQYRFVRSEKSYGRLYMQQEILCGQGGGLCGEPTKMKLVRGMQEFYASGATYSQEAHEIHLSLPQDGTVTLIRREFLDDVDHAFVYWDIDKEWITAEPRDATLEEVVNITQNALQRWF